MLKKYVFGLALCYTIALAIVSLIHVSSIPKINYSNSDKIFHFLAYGGLTWFWFQAFYNTFKWSFNKSLSISVIISIVFGTLIEVLQGVLTKTRVADNNDILANTLGVSLTVVILLLLKKTVVKK